MYEVRLWSDAGGLMSYGFSSTALYHRAASFVDRILKGARSGRPAGRAARAIRVHYQPEGCGGDRADDPSVGALSGHRNHAISSGYGSRLGSTIWKQVHSGLHSDNPHYRNEGAD